MQPRVQPHGDNYSHSDREVQLIRCIHEAGIRTTLSSFHCKCKGAMTKNSLDFHFRDNLQFKLSKKYNEGINITRQ